MALPGALADSRLLGEVKDSQTKENRRYCRCQLTLLFDLSISVNPVIYHEGNEKTDLKPNTPFETEHVIRQYPGGNDPQPPDGSNGPCPGQELL